MRGGLPWETDPGQPDQYEQTEGLCNRSHGAPSSVFTLLGMQIWLHSKSHGTHSIFKIDSWIYVCIHLHNETR